MDAHPEGAPLELAESTDAALAEAESLARRWHGAAGGRLRWCFAPRFVPSCSGPLLRAASDLAERHGAQLHTHAAETIVERETVLRTTGLEEIAYLDSVGIAGPRAALAHCVWVDAHETARLARQGTTVVHCPSSNLKLASGVAKVPELLAAGCHVAIGADGAPCNNRLDVFAEMRLAALIQKPRLGADALPAGRVLELATLGGARASPHGQPLRCARTAPSACDSTNHSHLSVPREISVQMSDESTSPRSAVWSMARRMRSPKLDSADDRAHTCSSPVEIVSGYSGSSERSATTRAVPSAVPPS